MRNGFSEKPGTWFAILFFALISIGHLLRFLYQIPVQAGNITILIWASIPGCLVAAALAWLIWRENRR